MSERSRAIVVLTATTVAFTVCFAAWTLYGVLITYLADRQIVPRDQARVGWLIGIPVLSGSLLRLPVGMLTDRFGGRIVMAVIMLIAGAAMYGVSLASGFWSFLLGGVGFGVAGASFAAGVAYTSLWFPPNRQGTALGVFGIGNAGAALTSLFAPRLLQWLTHGGADVERWRMLPRIYALALVTAAVTFWFTTFTRKPDQSAQVSLRARLAPLASVRVWRFGLYYFLMFGGFVALSQWLIPYYLNVYALSLVTAGLLASAFSLPAGLFRVLGGWLADRIGARAVMYSVLSASIVLLVLLFPPRVELQAPGQGIGALRPGVVTAVSETEIVVGSDRYVLQQEAEDAAQVRLGIHRNEEGFLLLPTASFHQVPAVAVGDTVARGQPLVRGVTRVYFQANKWVFTVLVFLLGVTMGIGGGAVLKYVSQYFPGRVGIVGGTVGMLGALGGLVYPVVFGYALGTTGIWTTCWMALAIVAVACLAWLHITVRRMMAAQAPALMREVEPPIRY